MFSESIEYDILNYYHSYCELTIWFKKIMLQANPTHYITVQDITEEFIAERNHILNSMPEDRKKTLRQKLNKIASKNYFKVSHWSRKQKVTVDMV